MAQSDRLSHADILRTSQPAAWPFSFLPTLIGSAPSACRPVRRRDAEAPSAHHRPSGSVLALRAPDGACAARPNGRAPLWRLPPPRECRQMLTSPGSHARRKSERRPAAHRDRRGWFRVDSKTLVKQLVDGRASNCDQVDRTGGLLGFDQQRGVSDDQHVGVNYPATHEMVASALIPTGGSRSTSRQPSSSSMASQVARVPVPSPPTLTRRPARPARS